MTTDTDTQKDKKDQKDTYSAYFELHTALRDAYWSTPDEATGNKITAAADACYFILTELNRDGIKKRNKDYTNLKMFAEQTNNRLKKVKEDIDQIIHSVSIATKVVDWIEKVLVLAAKFFV